MGAVGVVRDWRSGPADRVYRMRPFLPAMDAEWWFAFRRSTLVQQTGYTGLVAAYAFPSAILPAGAAIVASLALCVPIALFNRPRFLVPPKLRDQPGFLTKA